MNWKKLYADHVATQQKNLETVLGELALDSLVLSSGSVDFYFEDDQGPPFRPSPHFAHWLPLWGADHFLVLSPPKKPKLYLYQPDDFWHDHDVLVDSFWVEHFAIEVVKNREDFWSSFKAIGSTAYHGPHDLEKARECGLEVAFPGLEARLNWYRSLKTPYELEAIREATALAASGHKAAALAFQQGLSEREVFYRYLENTGLLEREMPYEPIIALNEKGGILHYHGKRKEIRNGVVLLIDAGAAKFSYASDITRTYPGEKAHSVFRDLVSGLDAAQQGICQMLRPGMSFEEPQMEAHRRIADLLIETGILKGIDREDAVDKKLTSVFFPHGLGHLLGIQVHDVGGSLKIPSGELEKPFHQFPKLRLTRTLDTGMALTIEPGIYFIPMLLQPQEQGANQKFFDWKLIQQLYSHGGIRIEDNIFIEESKGRNVTREYLP